MNSGLLQRFFMLIFLLKNVKGQQEVNIMFIYDSTNTLAKMGYDTAVKYLAQNSAEGVVVKNSHMVPVSSGDSIELTVNNTCAIYDAAVDDGAAPHLVIDATLTGMLSETSKSLTKVLQLPTFTSSYGQEGDLREWRNLSPDQEGYLVQVMPPGDIIVQVIRDIVKSQNFTNAAILYDDTFIMEHKYKSLLQNLPTRHIIVMAEKTTNDLRTQIKRLKSADIVNYFIVGQPKTIRDVLEAATAGAMFGRKFAWYSLSKEKDDIGCSCENATVVHMRPQTTSTSRGRINVLRGSYGLDGQPEIDSAFYFDHSIRGIKAIGDLVKQGRFTAFEFQKCSQFNEVEPLPPRKELNLKAALQSVTMIDAVAPITWGQNGRSYHDINLGMEKIMILGGQVVQRTNLGEWAAGMPGRLMFKAGQSLADHQAVTVYRVTTVEQAPFIQKRMVNGKEEFYGYCIDLIDEIRSIVKFEYEISTSPDNQFGNMNENMEWNGMIKELIEKRADIALAPLAVMAERENVVDFTVPYYDLVGITILMKKPKVPTSLFKFLTVLEPEVWICILVAYIFTSILLFIFDRFSPYSYQNNREKYKDDDEKREFSLKESLWFCMTSLTPQGGGEAPKNLSGRLVAATWWLFGFIIIASYTANLAAFLTVSRLDTPIESLDDLSNQYKIQYAPMNGTATMTYFERMAYIEKKFYEIWKDMSLNDSMSEVERAKLAVWDYPVSDKYTKMWQSMQEAGLPNTFEEALARVRASQSSSEGFAFLGDATDIRYQELVNCDLQIVGEEFSRKPYAIAVQQGSPLKDQFNDAILKLLNQRKLETLKERWWNQNPNKKKCEEDDDQSDGISIENIGGVFIVIFVGIALACATLAFEFWWYRGRKSRVTSSGRVVEVKEFDNGHNGEKKFRNGNGLDIAPVGNPW